jgi:hypothetical protein
MPYGFETQLKLRVEVHKVSTATVPVSRFLEEDRKEMAEMRRQQQEILNVEPGRGTIFIYVFFSVADL